MIKFTAIIYLKFMDQGSTYLNIYIYRCLIIITWVWFSQEIGTKVRSTSNVAEVVLVIFGDTEQRRIIYHAVALA